MKSYSELVSFPDFESRFRYLKLHGEIGDQTFGGSRLLNQRLYTSDRWKSFRDMMVIRDSLYGDFPLDLGIPERGIAGTVILHHINPITKQQILEDANCIYDPENVICCSLDTHNAIHYGDISYLDRDRIVDRQPFDTTPWR